MGGLPVSLEEKIGSGSKVGRLVGVKWETLAEERAATASQVTQGGGTDRPDRKSVV